MGKNCCYGKCLLGCPDCADDRPIQWAKMPIVDRFRNRNVRCLRIQYLNVNLRPLGRFDIQYRRNYFTGLDTGRIEEQRGQEPGLPLSSPSW